MPIFRPEGGHKTQHTCLQRQKLHIITKLERQQKDFLKFILNSQFMGVFLIHLEPIDEYANTPRSSLENYT